jgi:hypothetical protein
VPAPPAAESASAPTPEPAEDPAAPGSVEGTGTPGLSVVDQRLEVEPAADPGIELVRSYTRMFFEGELDALREQFSAEMKEEFPPGRLQLMRERVRDNLGEEIELVGEDSQMKDGYRGYVRWAKFSKHDAVVEIQWVLHEDDTVAGFMIREARPSQP